VDRFSISEISISHLPPLVLCHLRGNLSTSPPLSSLPLQTQVQPVNVMTSLKLLNDSYHYVVAVPKQLDICVIVGKEFSVNQDLWDILVYVKRNQRHRLNLKCYSLSWIWLECNSVRGCIITFKELPMTTRRSIFSWSLVIWVWKSSDKSSPKN